MFGEDEDAAVRRFAKLVEQRDLAGVVVTRRPEHESEAVLVRRVRNTMEDSRKVLVEDHGNENADMTGRVRTHHGAPTGSSTEMVVPAPRGLTTLMTPAI